MKSKLAPERSVIRLRTLRKSFDAEIPNTVNFVEIRRLGSLLNSTQLKFIENGSRMAKGIQYIKTTQMINVNENLKTNKR